MIEMKLKGETINNAPFPHTKSLTISEYFLKDSVAVGEVAEDWKNDGKNTETRGFAKKGVTVDGDTVIAEAGPSSCELEPFRCHRLYANAPSPEIARVALLEVVKKINSKAGSLGIITHFVEISSDDSSVLEDMSGSQSGLDENQYRVIVDYGQNLKQMIKNSKFVITDPSDIKLINQNNFPISGNGKQSVVIELVPVDQSKQTRAKLANAALEKLKSKSMRPATLPEFLALGAANPRKRWDFHIFALGSDWQDYNGHRQVACLGCWWLGRELCLRQIEQLILGPNGLDGDFPRFAAVRK